MDFSLPYARRGLEHDPQVRLSPKPASVPSAPPQWMETRTRPGTATWEHLERGTRRVRSHDGSASLRHDNTVRSQVDPVQGRNSWSAGLRDDYQHPPTGCP
jgi:hypothetical protein